MRSAFTDPNEAMPYSYDDFPKAESAVTEYTGLEGVSDYQLKGFGENPEVVGPTTVETPVVKPAIFQDFKDVLPPA